MIHLATILVHRLEQAYTHLYIIVLSLTLITAMNTFNDRSFYNINALVLTTFFGSFFFDFPKRPMLTQLTMSLIRLAC